MDYTVKRPTSVTVIGYIFLALSLLMIASGALGYFATATMRGIGGPPPSMPEDMPKAFTFMFEYYGVLAAIQVLLAIFMLIASINFLKLRAWARLALEVICWLGIIYVVSFGIIWVVTWLDMTSKVSSGQSSGGPPPIFRMIGMAMAIVVTVIGTAPSIALIVFLRGRTVRDAVSGSSTVN